MRKSVFLQGLALIPNNRRRESVYVLIVITFASLLDLISLAMFIPLLAILLDPQHSENIVRIFPFLSNYSWQAIALTFGSLLITFIILKIVFTSYGSAKKAKYAYSIAETLALTAFQKFITQPYKTFLSADFTREMNRISNVPLTFANNFIIPITTIFSESVLALLLLCALLFYEPAAFAGVIGILAPIALLSAVVRKQVRKSSNRIKNDYPLLLKQTLQSIEGLTEIRVFNKEDHFKNRFSETYKRISKIFSFDHLINSTTSRLTELAATLLICALIGYAILTDKPIQESVMLLSVYAAAIIRLLPSINRILGALVQMNSHEFATTELSSIIVDVAEPHKLRPISFKEKLEFRNASFSYDNRYEVFSKINITIQKNDRVVLSGRSGVGKSTFLNLLVGFLQPTSGSVLVDGIILDAQHALKNVGYVPQNPFILDDTILRNVAFGEKDKDIDTAKVNQVLTDLGLISWVNSLQNGLETVIGERGATISGGQRQRIAIARVLYHNAEIILLDEVTNQLDPSTEYNIIKCLDGEKAFKEKTLVVVTHHPERWKTFDNLYVMESGQIRKLEVETLQQK